MVLGSRDTINRPAVLVLSCIHAVGIVAMYGLVVQNGYVKALLQLRNHGPHLLPGSNHPILTRFIGIPPLDKLLTLAGVMFANVTDGSHPQLSLYGSYFGGQLIGIFTIMVLEGLRQGNKQTSIAQSALWGCAMQATGYGFTMPVYAIVHLLTSPTVGPPSPALRKAVQISDPTLVRVLPAATIIGYILPTILMALPLPWNTLHQWLGGFWQGFPIWVLLAQHLLAYRHHRHQAAATAATTAATTSSSSSSPFPPRTHNSTAAPAMRALRRVYSLAFTACAISHWATIAILATNRLLPSHFPPHLRASFTPSNVFLPPPFWAPGPMPNMAEGIHNFFQYDLYVGAVASLVWVTAINANRFEPRRLTWGWWARLVWRVALRVGVAGPGGGLVALMWERDGQVLGDGDCS